MMMMMMMMIIIIIIIIIITVRIMKSFRLRWAVHAISMGKKENANGIMAGKRPLESERR
jgi:hypothetical protein